MDMTKYLPLIALVGALGLNGCSSDVEKPLNKVSIKNWKGSNVGCMIYTATGFGGTGNACKDKSGRLGRFGTVCGFDLDNNGTIDEAILLYGRSDPYVLVTLAFRLGNTQKTYWQHLVASVVKPEEQLVTTEHTVPMSSKEREFLSKLYNLTGVNEERDWGPEETFRKQNKY